MVSWKRIFPLSLGSQSRSWWETNRTYPIKIWLDQMPISSHWSLITAETLYVLQADFYWNDIVTKINRLSGPSCWWFRMESDGFGWIQMDSDGLNVFRSPLGTNQNRNQSQFFNYLTKINQAIVASYQTCSLIDSFFFFFLFFIP